MLWRVHVDVCVCGVCMLVCVRGRVAMSKVMTQQESHVTDPHGREFFRESVAETAMDDHGSARSDGVSSRAEEPRQENHGSEAAITSS